MQRFYHCWKRKAATGKSKFPKKIERRLRFCYTMDSFDLLVCHSVEKCTRPFHGVMDVILSTVYWQFALVNLSDIVIIWKSLKTHIRHVRRVLTPLCDACVTIVRKSAMSSQTPSTTWVTLFTTDNCQYHNTPLLTFATCLQRISWISSFSRACESSFDVWYTTLQVYQDRRTEILLNIILLNSRNLRKSNYSPNDTAEKLITPYVFSLPWSTNTHTLHIDGCDL